MEKENNFSKEVENYIDDKGVSEFSIYISKMQIYDSLGKQTSLLIDQHLSKIHSMAYGLLSLSLLPETEEKEELYLKGKEILAKELNKYYKIVEDLIKEKK